MYREGISTTKIAHMFGVSKQTVIYHLERKGISRRSNSIAHLANPEIAVKMLTMNQKQVIIGSALGDGHLKKQASYSFLQISHSEKQRDWLQYKGYLLSGLVVKPGIISRNPAGPNRQRIVELRTYPNIYIDEIRSRTYSETGKRTINDIVPEMEALGLAVLWGDDGSYGNHNGHEYGILSTCNFSTEDNESLAEVLRNKFAVECSVLDKKSNNKTYKQIRVSKSGMSTLREVVRPFLPESMLYKIGE